MPSENYHRPSSPPSPVTPAENHEDVAALNKELWGFVVAQLSDWRDKWVQLGPTAELNEAKSLMCDLYSVLRPSKLKRAWPRWSFNGGNVPAIRGGKELCFACAYAEWTVTSHPCKKWSSAGHGMCECCLVQWNGQTGSSGGPICTSNNSLYARLVTCLDLLRSELSIGSLRTMFDAELHEKVTRQLSTAFDICDQILKLPLRSEYSGLTVSQLICGLDQVDQQSMPCD